MSQILLLLDKMLIYKQNKHHSQKMPFSLFYVTEVRLRHNNLNLAICGNLFEKSSM